MPPKSPKQTKASLAAGKAEKAVTVQQTNTDYEETQCNELEVIKSMFPEEYELIEKASAWKKSAIAFRLHLKASSNTNFATTISVEFTATYPKTAPIISIEDTKGLSAEKKDVLSKKIKDVIQENLGMEMVWMIATAVQDYIDEQAETREADDKKPNLLDEMALKAEVEKKALEEKAERQRKKEEQKRLEAERKEQEAYEKQAKQRVEQEKELKEKAKPKVGFIDDGMYDVVEGDAVKFDRRITIKHGGETYNFNKVAGMVRLGRGPLTTIYSVRPLLPNGKENTLGLALKQVDIFDPHRDCGEGKRHLVDLEADLDKLRSFTHPSVIQLYDSSIEELPPHEESNLKGWRISILMELSTKGSLAGLLQTVDTISPNMARTWVVQLLEGLDAVHKEGLVHRAVHVDNVLLFTPSSSSKSVLKLSDVGLAHRLWLMKHHKKGSQTPMVHSKSAFWLPPEQANSQAMTKKADVWNLGIVIVQMFFGLDVIEKYRSPKDLMDELELSEIMLDFLAKIFRQDPKKRSTPFELLPSEFLRSNASIWENDSPLQSPSQGQDSLTLPTPRKRRESNIMLDRPGSRYDSEFTEGSRLGKGGFGEVVKARHKIDGRVYAIKKVHQAGTGSLDQVLSEVMLLSRISHQYIVRYYGAWIEEDRANMIFNNSSESEYSIRSLDPDTKSNLRGNASRGLDFISSTGFEIEFGYDDDDDEPEDDSDDDDDEDCDEAEESSSTDGEGRAVISYEISEAITESEDEESDSEDDDRTSSLRVVESHLSTSPRAHKLTKVASRENKRLGATLYIQMEYCEKQTLRDLIHQDLQSNIDGCWILLRQILEGLAYLHNMGIIHRDLKPDNIFLDEKNHPKIGDFGLATMGQKELIQQTVTPDVDQDMTREVGTALYVAPELSASSLGSYTSKVDMYSLGIIYFEMCVAFSTSMERGQVIHSIRKANFELPPEFPAEKRPSEASIVKSLLAHNPDGRPSAQELLTSGIIPFKVEDESMRQILHSLTEPSSVHHQNVLRTLFGRPTIPLNEPFFDASLKTQQMATSDALLQMQVKEKLITIFRNHGGVEATRPFLIPDNEYYTKSEAVRLLDESGMVVNMPYDLTLSHARQLARCPPSYTKSFCFGTVFRDNLPIGGQPRSHSEVVFDIVSSSSRDLAIKEAEVIKVLDEIIDAFPQFKTLQMCYHINHADLLDLIMEFCRIKPEESADVKNILSKLNQGDTTWNTIRQELRSPPISLSSTSLDDLQRFDWRETDLDKALKRINTIFTDSVETSTCSSIFTHVKAVVKSLVGYEVKRSVYINPLATYNDKFYKGGLMFQCVNDSKRRTVFAAGGRYDTLIRDCRPRMPNQPELVHAVGFNLASDSLYKSMVQYHKKSSRKPTKGQNEYSEVWIKRRCDVLVASLDLEILRSQGMNLVAELWANNIKAELAAEATEHLHRQDGDDSYGWMVVIKPSGPTPNAGEMSLKVKNLIKNKEKDMYSRDLVMHLQLEIGERNKSEVHAERHRIQRQISNQETSSNSKPKEYDDLAGVTILQPVKGGKKVKRPNVINASQRKAAELGESFEDCPVVAVELKDETLDLIRATQLQGPESWKKLIQSTSQAERKYLGEIKEVLDEMAEKRKWKNAFLYNIRTDVLYFYYLY